MNYSARVLAALALLSGASAVRADSPVPACSPTVSAEACSCGAEVRRGDDRLKLCADAPAARAAAPAPASAPADPAARAAAVVASVRKFGFFGLTADGGYITGADGSGAANGSVGVTFYQQRTKIGTFSAEAEIGRFRMGGIPIDNVQNVGVVGQLPNGAPINGTVTTTGVSPAVTYVPLAALRYAPPLNLGRVHPYAIAELGISRLSSTNAVVNSTLVATVGGQPVGSQNLGTSLQPTGEARNHPGGGIGGGATVDLTRTVALDSQFIDAPSGYKVYKTGIVIVLDRPK